MGDGRRRLPRAIPALAGCSAVLLTPVVVGALLLAWLVSSFEGCDVDIDADLGPTPVGVTGRAGGPVTARVPSCGSRQFAVLRLLASDGSTVWRADGLGGRRTSVGQFTVGTAPRGFRDTVPLAGQSLDPRAAYDLQLLVVAPTEPAVGPASSTGLDPALLFGATARFRPADLRPDRVWLDGRLVAPARFDRLACTPTPTSTSTSAPGDRSG